MEFEIFLPEKNKKRLLAISVMAVLFLFDLWQRINWFLTGEKGPVTFFDIFFGYVVSLGLPLIACIGMALRKYWGIQYVAVWMGSLAFLYEVKIVNLGPVFGLERIWLVPAILLFLLWCVGLGELWASLWYKPASTKRFLPAWTEKTVIPTWIAKIILIGLVFLLQAALAWIFIKASSQTGFAYAKLTPAPAPMAAFTPAGTLVSSFGFQVDLPSSAQILNVSKKYGDMDFKVGKELWRLESRYQLADSVRSISGSPDALEKFIRERYGVVPKFFKSMLFGDKPDYFFEIKKEDLWVVGSIYQEKSFRFTTAYLCVMDPKGKPMGSLNAEISSADPKDWQWVYSIRKADSRFQTAEGFEAEAERLSGMGDYDWADLFLASAYLKGPAKADDPRRLIQDVAKHVSPKRAKYLLSGILEDSPGDASLKAIKINP